MPGVAGMYGAPCPCISYSPHKFACAKTVFQACGLTSGASYCPSSLGGWISHLWWLVGKGERDHLSTSLGSEQAVKCHWHETHGPSPGPTRSSSGHLRARGPAQRASKIRSALGKTKHSLVQDEASGLAVAMAGGTSYPRVVTLWRWDLVKEWL